MHDMPAEARLFPWATDDAVISAHRWSVLRWAGSIWPFFAALGFWAALNVQVVVKPPPDFTPLKHAAIVGGMLALILGLFGFVLYMAAWRFTRRTRAFFVFPEGFVYQDSAGEWGGARWGDVQELWRAETVQHGVTTRSHVRLVTSDADVLLDRALNGYPKVADDVEQRAARATLPGLLARTRAGERLAFGELEIHATGITLRGRDMLWDEITGYKIVNGALVVVGPKVDVWRGNGVRFRDVPNLSALLAILNIAPWAALRPTSR